VCVRVCVYTGEKGSAKGAALGGAATAATARRNDIVKEVLAVQDNTHTRAYWGRQLTPGSGSRKQGTLKQAIWECCCQIGTQLKWTGPQDGIQCPWKGPKHNLPQHLQAPVTLGTRANRTAIAGHGVTNLR
jgi:hypothetical protein